MHSSDRRTPYRLADFSVRLDVAQTQVTGLRDRIRGSDVPAGKGGWKTNREGMRSTACSPGELDAAGTTLAYVRYLDDFPAFRSRTLWTDIDRSDSGIEVYVVQTNTRGD